MSKPVIPTNAYICEDGHITEADDWDKTNVVAANQPPEFDYTKACRRYVWREAPGERLDLDQFDSVEGGRAMKQVRCQKPVQAATVRPEVYAAFLLGGEDAAREIMIQVLSGQAPKDQRS